MHLWHDCIAETITKLKCQVQSIRQLGNVVGMERSSASCIWYLVKFHKNIRKVVEILINCEEQVNEKIQLAICQESVGHLLAICWPSVNWLFAERHRGFNKIWSRQLLEKNNRLFNYLNLGGKVADFSQWSSRRQCLLKAPRHWQPIVIFSQLPNSVAK